MDTQDENTLQPQHALILTKKGEKELRGSRTSRSPLELALLVLVDGKSTVADLAGRARSLTPAQALAGYTRLFEADLVRRPVEAEINALDFGLDFGAPPLTARPGDSPETHAEADHGAASLRQSGYFVRIARHTGAARTLPGDRRLSVVVVEDEPSLGKLLRQLLVFEGFEARVATNREEILAELRRQPLPDLVLLDVVLPDADGFDVLYKMRQHPALKSIPVIMLTAQATREAVLKGLAGRADGYVTKPFEVDVLIRAVRTVLGLPAA
ncbi:MAG: response regulator [Burkholderiales bacterium]|nr:response regulator [Burkholderiales bacterium]